MTARPGKKADDAVGRRDRRPGLRAGPEVTQGGGSREQVGVSVGVTGSREGVLSPEGSLWPLWDSCPRKRLWCPISQQGMLRAGSSEGTLLVGDRLVSQGIITSTWKRPIPLKTGRH